MSTADAVIDAEAVEVSDVPAPAPSAALALVDPISSGAIIRAEEPREILRKAHAIAEPLKELIESAGLSVALDKRNPDRKHVEVGGWQATGTLLGALGGQPLHAETVWTRRIVGEDGRLQRTTYTATVRRFHSKAQGGGLREEITYEVDGHDWEACVEIKTAGGVIVGRAEAMVSRAENTWAQRDDYALRSMAETRAESRAWRKAIGWIVNLAGYNPTPAEEMGHTPGADTSAPAAAEMPAWAAPAGDETKKAMLVALTSLFSDRSLAIEFAKATAKALGGQVPEVVAQIVASLPQWVQAGAECTAAAGQQPDPAAAAEPSAQPAGESDASTWATAATDEALLQVAKAGDGADPGRVAAAQAELDRRHPDDGPPPGSVDAPADLPKDPAKAVGTLVAAGCICIDPLGLHNAGHANHDVLCPLKGHGTAF